MWTVANINIHHVFRVFNYSLFQKITHSMHIINSLHLKILKCWDWIVFMLSNCIVSNQLSKYVIKKLFPLFPFRVIYSNIKSKFFEVQNNKEPKTLFRKSQQQSLDRVWEWNIIQLSNIYGKVQANGSGIQTCNEALDLQLYSYINLWLYYYWHVYLYWPRPFTIIYRRTVLNNSEFNFNFGIIYICQLGLHGVSIQPEVFN